MNPQVSIIVPIYNVEPYLRQCLDSILNQTFSGLEVILVDDGSTDACGAICDEYAAADARVRVIHNENGGLVSARKAGLNEATCTYATYVDSDDFLEPGLIGACISVMTDTDADVLLHGYLRDDGKERIPKQNNIADGVYEGEALAGLRENMLSLREDAAVSGDGLHESAADAGGFRSAARFFRFRFGVEPAVWAKLFRRELLVTHQMPVPDDITIGEDVAVTYPLLLESKRVVIDSGLNGYHYRISPDSMTRAFNPGYFRRISSLYAYLQQALGTDENETMREAVDDYRIYLIRTELEKIRYADGMTKEERIRHLAQAADGTAVMRGIAKAGATRFSGELLRRMEWAEAGKWERIERSYVKENIKSAIYNFVKGSGGRG
ncbi:MAG: glycosyltransferase family 2 protein [Butyrivibrio sp.]|nr:glycosyltransferase family 2 protein [Butyrivibrio sp.]